MSQTFGTSRFESIVDRSITEIRSNVPSIGQYAFYGCTNLITAEFPKAMSVGTYAFYGCSTLTTAIFPHTTSFGDYAFQNCSNLTNVVADNTSSLGTGCFSSCSKLITVNIPMVASLWNYVFSSCSSLEGIVMPSFNGRFNASNFDECTNLSYVDLGAGTGGGPIQSNNFRNTKITNLILRKSNSIVTLGYTNNFDGTPFASGGSGGTIYIPKVLYDHLGDGTNLDYKAASNWSTIDGYGTITWAQIEGSQYENYYADGTPIV